MRHSFSGRVPTARREGQVGHDGRVVRGPHPVYRPVPGPPYGPDVPEAAGAGRADVDVVDAHGGALRADMGVRRVPGGPGGRRVGVLPGVEEDLSGNRGGRLVSPEQPDLVGVRPGVEVARDDRGKSVPPLCAATNSARAVTCSRRTPEAWTAEVRWVVKKGTSWVGVARRA